MSKSTPFSVRLLPEDADFIASLEMDDAITPSDKIRSIIRDARLKYESGSDYASGLKNAREALRPITQAVKALELEEKQHSELVAAFLDWVAEAYAYAAAARQIDGKNGKIDAKQLEADIVDRCFRLFELIARMGVTSKAPCYNKEIINAHFESLEELIQLINTRIHK